MLRIALGERFPSLRSFVFCLEDSIAESSVRAALINLEAVLGQLRLMDRLPAERPTMFVRPRNVEMLRLISKMSGADLTDGYVIPKVTTQNLQLYLAALPTRRQYILPTIESREAFEPREMRSLRELLLVVQERVLAIRIGGNDLLQTLNAKRSNRRTAYDGPLGHVVASLISLFVPRGFSMSAPVFEDYQNAGLLAEEVERDIEHGLLTKSAIHPAQVDVIQDAYRVSRPEYEKALAIARNNAPAVFAKDGSMCELATHLRWARSTITRGETFGFERPLTENLSIAG